jgi:hypothetical protein
MDWIAKENVFECAAQEQKLSRNDPYLCSNVKNETRVGISESYDERCNPIG